MSVTAVSELAEDLWQTGPYQALPAQEACPDDLDAAIAEASRALVKLQHPEGCWSFELEADCTIPAEYVMMMHFLGEVDRGLEANLARFLRAHQEDHGGWPLFQGGPFDLSCSVKAYYALKLAGDDPSAPNMVRARQAILAAGGAARSNVFTRIALALFGQVPWRAVPFIPVEIMLLPRWFPFHISKVSYWSRTVMVPLFILCSLKAKARNPCNVDIQELFLIPPEEEEYFTARSTLNRLFLWMDAAGRRIEPLIPARVRKRALARAEQWFVERLNGEHGLGAIFPAMVNAAEALACLGYPPEHPHRQITKAALEKLLVVGEEDAYCQPCVSPVWDTALASLTLLEAAGGLAKEPTLRALDWLERLQVVEHPGDWRESRPDLEGGGWAFQFENPHYPDLDDTAVVALAMHLARSHRYHEPVLRAANWICGMQSRNGGFAAFDVDNTHYYLNEIPFADHGALLDPPTADVSARCATLLARLNWAEHSTALTSCIEYLRREQEPEGCWFGRWGTNYIYGTWSVLVAFEAAGVPADDPQVQRAVSWLKQMQNEDGGWGEGCDTYFDGNKANREYPSTSFQTAWAILGLLAAGETASPEVLRGIDFLARTQEADGLWHDDCFTAPGFPRVFYLKYHGYSAYFPLWALARYRNLNQGRRWVASAS